ncbi:hypothetical protein HYT54_04140 [Candidatus Woesearchaeota archaeon]|nr:hypothetical protein [Candidatus Woesearchaeota archaeon]
MVVSVEDIIRTASREGYMADFNGLIQRMPAPALYHSGNIRIAQFMLERDNMWHDAGNADSLRQSPAFRGRQALYLDNGHEVRNPNLSASDYLFTFKEYMRVWAARKHEGSPEKDWAKMQQELVDRFLSYV